MKTKIPSNYINSFSEQLRKLLKENHLTQQQLADSVGVTLNAVNDWINNNSQPKWLLQLFGTMKFFYENVDGFSPIQLFYLDGNYPTDPLQSAIEKGLEQNVRAKVEQEYRVKLEETLKKEVMRIETQANAEIRKAKDKYKTYDIDRLLEENKRLEKGLRPVGFGREDYTQYKEKLEKKYNKLKQEFEEYKETYNGLALAELNDDELDQISRAVTYKSKSDGPKRMKNLLKNSDFLRLLYDTMNCLLYEEPALTYSEVGERLCKSLEKIVPKGY